MTRKTDTPFAALTRGGRRFGAILADPPWRFATRSTKGRGRSPDGADPHGRARLYETMTLDAIKALPVADLAAPNCALFVWAIDPMIPEALDVGRAWGFTFKTLAFVWAKTAIHDPRRFPMGTGYWTRANPETCILFTRGRPQRLARDVPRLIVAPRREHSRKPDETRGRIERLVAGPYVELFARQSAPGWRAWGNQIDRFPESP